MKKPKVTVLMSVYNGEKYLREAIDSILSQTFKNYEFLIVNDGSTDKTEEILKSYNDPRIKIIKNEKNIGLTKSLNKGLKLAIGEYIARQDADDISMPERLEKELNFLKSDSDYMAVGTFNKIIDNQSRIVKTIYRPEEFEDIKKDLRNDNCITHGSALIKKELFYIIGNYDEFFTYSQDYELWLRTVKNYKVKNLPRNLYLLRKHENSIESNHILDQKIYVLLAKLKNEINEDREAVQFFINYLFKNQLFKKDNIYWNFMISFLNKIRMNRIYKYPFSIIYQLKIIKLIKLYRSENISLYELKSEIDKIIG